MPNRFMIMLISLACLLPLACSKQESAEQPGAAGDMDAAQGQQAQQQQPDKPLTEKAKESVEQTMQTAGEKVDQAAEAVGEQVDKVKEKTGEQLEKAGQTMQQGDKEASDGQ